MPLHTYFVALYGVSLYVLSEGKGPMSDEDTKPVGAFLCRKALRVGVGIGTAPLRQIVPIVPDDRTMCVHGEYEEEAESESNRS